ncbi:LGFP repeat-containing protein [Gordonia westfalica]|uniref:LGFP repeat-containing protein n=1 Tax=Gordonia westfalica TaxID=158898 RepID=A0A1H2DPX1_9ACTN|nr:hypothetical protein [Gordonia westfalica]SDT84940.1 LGFP repeat-containing protein [Gordonia westfalica]
MKLFRQRLLQAPDKPLVVMNMIELEAKENPWVGVRKAKPGAGGERKVGRDGKGRFVEYENAHIYFHPATGAHAIPHGGLFEAYAERKWETGELGFPVRDFTKLADGAVMAFQGGVLYRKDGKDHHVVKASSASAGRSRATRRARSAGRRRTRSRTARAASVRRSSTASSSGTPQAR